MLSATSFFQSLHGLVGGKSDGGEFNAIAARLGKGKSLVVPNTVLALLDQRWRWSAGDALWLAPLYARSLYGSLLLQDVPLALTYALARQSEDPVSHCVHAINLVHRGQAVWALSYAREILTKYAVDSDPALADMLDLIADLLNLPGWIGYSTNWQAVGRLVEPSKKSPNVAGYLVIGPARIKVLQGQDRLFSLAPQDSMQEWELTEVRYRDAQLLTAAQHPRTVPMSDGRISMTDGQIKGWFCYQRSPLLRPKVVLSTRSGVPLAQLLPARSSFARWAFAVNLNNSWLQNDWIAATAAIDGVGDFSLPDSPLLLRPAKREPAKARRPALDRSANASVSATVTVIIPVFNHLDDAQRCIQSALLALPPGWSILIIDDASTAPNAQQRLSQFGEMQQVEYIRNEHNVGYAQSVNLGIARAINDVVLLNSDAVVFKGVFEHLRAVADSQPQIATVTATSTDDSIAGINLARSDEKTAIGLAQQIHRTLVANCQDEIIEVPTGVGHCLYLKRACIEDIGTFDAQTFPSGYGEETDFCFRATARGWKHVIATGAFIFHAGGKSFASRRLALLERAEAIMLQRHKGYAKTIARCVADTRLHRFRRRIYEQLLRAYQSPLALLIAPRLIGGVDRAVSEQADKFRKLGITPLILHPANTTAGETLELWCAELGSISLIYQGAEQQLELHELLAWLSFEAIQIHHFSGIPASLIEQLVERGADRTEIFVHDYSWACPRINLLGKDGVFCNTPAIRACDACVRQQGSLLAEDIGVRALRQRTVRLFERVKKVQMVSTDIHRRLAKMLDSTIDRASVYPLEVSNLVSPAYVPAVSRQRAKIVLLGAIGIHKGYDVMLQCLRDAKKRQLPLDFVVIGITADDSKLQKFENLLITGAYKESEAEYLLGREQPDIFFCGSIVPESWCYTLTYAIRLGMPIVAYNFGAPSERLAKLAGNKLIPLKTNAQSLNNLFLDMFEQQSSKIK